MWKNQWLQSKRAGATITLGTYVAFFDDLTDAFKEEEQVQNALHKLHNLRQTKNMLVEELNTEFRLLVGRAGLTWPTTAVFYFYILFLFPQTPPSWLGHMVGS